MHGIMDILAKYLFTEDDKEREEARLLLMDAFLDVNDHRSADLLREAQVRAWLLPEKLHDKAELIEWSEGVEAALEDAEVVFYTVLERDAYWEAIDDETGTYRDMSLYTDMAMARRDLAEAADAYNTNDDEEDI